MERWIELDNEAKIRFRSSADEFATGAVLTFVVVHGLLFAGVLESPLLVSSASFVGLVFFGMEWLETRRLRREQRDIEATFRKNGLVLLGGRVTEAVE